MPCVAEKCEPEVLDSTRPALDLPEGVPPLTSLYLYISGACNLACRHCWISPTFQPGDDGGQHIKLDYVRKAIDGARPLGLRSVKLTGGEPLLHPRFQDMVGLISDSGFRIVIETNGTLIDAALARFLKQTPEVSFISVSLDGAKPETHDSLRGVQGCYEQAIAGIRHLVEAEFSPRPQLICTLHKGNVSEMAQVIELAEELGCGSVKFNHVQVVGRGKQFAREQGLQIPEIIRLYHRVEHELRKQTELPIHFDIPLAFRPIRSLLNERLSFCTVLNILGVLSGGELSLCGIGVNVPELIYGELGEDAIDRVWCDSPGLVLLRKKIPAELEGICSQCLHRDSCLGACIANSFHRAGRLNAPYYFCEQAEKSGIFPDSRRHPNVDA